MLGLALFSSLLLRKPEKMFERTSSNMRKLGNTWEIRLVVPT